MKRVRVVDGGVEVRAAEGELGKLVRRGVVRRRCVHVDFDKRRAARRRCRVGHLIEVEADGVGTVLADAEGLGEVALVARVGAGRRAGHAEGVAALTPRRSYGVVYGTAGFAVVRLGKAPSRCDGVSRARLARAGRLTEVSSLESAILDRVGGYGARGRE